MKLGFVRLVAKLLILSLCALPYSTRAAMVGTDQVSTAAATQAQREQVRDFVSRADVQQQLQRFGLSADTAKDRVAAMTDEEIRTVSGQISSLPAGATSTAGWLLVIIIIAVIVYYVWK